MSLLSLLANLFSDTEEEETLPEPLVFGAELKCAAGTEHSYLMLLTDSIDINDLPQACVEDREKSVNVLPFGVCTLSHDSCELLMDLDEQWINDEPQRMMCNGKEVITTKSTLMCKRNMMVINAVTSGQDGVAAARIAAEMELYREMEEKYPGLLAILLDPYGSLYLNEGMYEVALRFLEDYLEKHGGEMEFISLYADDGLEMNLVKTTLDHLMPSFNMVGITELTDSIVLKGTEWGMDGMPGWDRQKLNAAMMEMIRYDCDQTAVEVAEDGPARLQEENRQYLQQISELASSLTYAYICYRCSMPTEDELAYKRTVSGQKSYGIEDTYSGDLMSPEEAARYNEYWRSHGIGSDETWNEFLKCNPDGTIDEYFNIIKTESPWPFGYNPMEVTLSSCDTFEMALGVGQPETTPGRFATSTGNIVDVDYVRNELAVKVGWKPEIDRVVVYQVKQGVTLPCLEGTVGPQIDLNANVYLQGGADQINILLDRSVNAMDYLDIISVRPIY